MIGYGACVWVDIGGNRKMQRAVALRARGTIIIGAALGRRNRARAKPDNLRYPDRR